MKTEVVSVSSGKVTILVGRYEISFSKRDGKIKKDYVIDHGSSRGRVYVPKELFAPAFQRAVAIIHDQEKNSVRM